MAFSVEDALKRLTNVKKNGQLAHAYLIHGASSAHQDELSEELAALILGCRREELASYPDVQIIQPTSKSRRILIEQIRLLEHFIQKRPSIGMVKVAILREADRLALNAANAFLKGLEEPPPGTYLLLLSHRPDALLPTILSRCIQIPLRLQEHRPPNLQEQAVIDLFIRCFQSQMSPIVQTFQFSRGFQGLLTEYKEKSESLEKFMADRERYKNATDGKWLQDQEEHLKALTESNALRLRRELIASLENYLAKILCAAYRNPSSSFERSSDPLNRIPGKNILRQLECLHRLQKVLDLGVNEALALETCFLEIFTLSASKST
ncbi:MAG: hypothetical protein C5B47_04975 [Verrucomicrobia bacterium]|nr:MAG: hypothetical protein C5B47_04975 [Verrucomicrobiota bacterium]